MCRAGAADYGLKQHPEFVLDNSRRALLGKHYQAALQAGIADDSAEINNYILDGVARDTAEQRHDHRVADLLRSEPAAAAPLQSSLQDQRPAPAPRRSMPVTAPVTREVPTGARREASNTVTLTGEQRAVARLSYNWLTPEQAEMEYARNLAKMNRLKASGEIQ